MFCILISLYEFINIILGPIYNLFLCVSTNFIYLMNIVEDYEKYLKLDIDGSDDICNLFNRKLDEINKLISNESRDEGELDQLIISLYNTFFRKCENFSLPIDTLNFFISYIGKKSGNVQKILINIITYCLKNYDSVSAKEVINGDLFLFLSSDIYKTNDVDLINLFIHCLYVCCESGIAYAFLDHNSVIQITINVILFAVNSSNKVNFYISEAIDTINISITKSVDLHMLNNVISNIVYNFFGKSCISAYKLVLKMIDTFEDRLRGYFTEEIFINSIMNDIISKNAVADENISYVLTILYSILTFDYSIPLTILSRPFYTEFFLNPALSSDIVVKYIDILCLSLNQLHKLDYLEQNKSPDVCEKMQNCFNCILNNSGDKIAYMYNHFYKSEFKIKEHMIHLFTSYIILSKKNIISLILDQNDFLFQLLIDMLSSDKEIIIFDLLYSFMFIIDMYTGNYSEKPERNAFVRKLIDEDIFCLLSDLEVKWSKSEKVKKRIRKLAGHINCCLEIDEINYGSFYITFLKTY